jgi:N-methylhydantoinase A
MGLYDAAFGIVRIANAQLVQSIRTLCVERGLDPRTMTLIPFGGAGPLYAGTIARDLGMKVIVVPRHPGVFAAEGLLAADIRHILQIPFRSPLERIATGNIESRLADLVRRLDSELAVDGVPPERRSIRFLGDLRYVGQFHEIVMPIPDFLHEPYDAAQLSAAFHRQHELSYGHADRAASVEIVNLRAEGIGRLDTPEMTDATEPNQVSSATARCRSVRFGANGAVDARIVPRASLAFGARIEGPAVITQKDSTIVVAKGEVAEVLPSRDIRITLSGG